MSHESEIELFNLTQLVDEEQLQLLHFINEGSTKETRSN